MASHRLTFSWQKSSEVLAKTVTKTADGDYSADLVSLAYNTVAQEVAIAFTASKLQSIYMYGSRNLLVMTRSVTTPGNSFELVADEPFVWVSNGYITNPFTTNVDKMFVRNTSGAAGDFYSRFLVDLTP